jgi:type IV pilus secretin PilQ/predicted competence protein
MQRLGLAAVFASWTLLSLAAPRITSLELPNTNEAPATVVLKVAGGTPEVSILRFPEACQGVVVVQKADLGIEPKAWSSPSARLLKGVTLRRIEPAGAQAAGSVQLTLELARGADFTVKTTDAEVRIDVQPARPAAALAPASSTQPIRIRNDDLDAMQLAEGTIIVTQPAGQDPAPDVLKGFLFYTPQAIPKAAPTTEEEREELLSQEIFQRRVWLNYKDEDLQNVIRSLAHHANLNIILTKDQVRGTVTLKLTNVRLGVALDAILKTNNLAYIVEQGGIVRIVPLSQVRTEKIELRTEYIPINWVKAANVANTLKPFLSEKGNMKSDDDANGLIITDTPEKVTQLSKLIEKMDVPEKQVMIEARLVDMSEEAQRNMGIDWTLRRVTGFDGSGNPVYGDQISIQESSRARNTISTSGNTLGFFGNDYDLGATLDFFEQRSLATVLANPRVVTLNNITAKINIKRMIPYISAQQTGQNQIGTVEFKETGVILEVTPNVTNNGYVRMTLKPEQKVRKGDFPSAQGFIPIVDERTVESNVIIKDEESVALGGLRQIENSTAESGVPWLLRIPVLGWFFKQEKTTHSKTELILFVTPHIVKDPSLTPAELQWYEKIDYNWDLPDYFYDEIKLRSAPPQAKSE